MEFEYWLVCALGKSAKKLDPKLELLDKDGRMKSEVIDFYDGRMIEKVKGKYTEQQILEDYYKS